MTPLQKLMTAVAALTLAVVLVLATVQRILEARDRNAFSREGDYVRLKGGRLRVRIVGAEHLPTVIFESGLGATLESWSAVQEATRPFARSLAYDRAGVGFSDQIGRTRDAKTIARELADLQDAVGLSKPSTLVCHSVGGLYCAVFAAQYPERVSGIVLVDPHHPDETLRISSPAAEEDRKLFEAYPRQLYLRNILGHRRFKDRDQLRTLQWAVEHSSRHWLGVADEGDHALRESLAQARDAMDRLAGKHISVVSAGDPVTDDRAIVHTLHRQFVERGTASGTQEIVPGAAHETLLSQPAGVDAIVRKIRAAIP